MNQETLIIHQLGGSYYRYARIKEACFEHWCEVQSHRFATDSKHFKLNDYLLNYYDNLWISRVIIPLNHLLGEFLSVATPEEIQWFLHQSAQEILNMYPSILLKIIREKIN